MGSVSVTVTVQTWPRQGTNNTKNHVRGAGTACRKASRTIFKPLTLFCLRLPMAIATHPIPPWIPLLDGSPESALTSFIPFIPLFRLHAINISNLCESARTQSGPVGGWMDGRMGGWWCGRRSCVSEVRSPTLLSLGVSPLCERCYIETVATIEYTFFLFFSFLLRPSTAAPLSFLSFIGLFWGCFC